MTASRRVQARDIVQRRILALLPRATADSTTITLTRRYTMLGHPASDTWTGDIPGLANRITLALYGVGDQDGPDDLQTPLREQLGDALIAAGAVPKTMPVEILGQAGVLADAVLPVALHAMESAATVHRRAGFKAAVEVMRQEKLPMSAGLLEAQLELDQLDVPAPEESPSIGFPAVFPWFELMDDEDRTEFLCELATAALAAPSTGAAYRDVEQACATWRGIAEAQHAHNTAPGPGAEDTTPQGDEEEDTQTGSQPAGAASTARGEILAVLQAAGYTEPAARDLVARADREPHDPDPDPDFRETLGGGHALVVEYGDCEMHASCQCGSRFGITTPDASLDTFVPAWEHHTNTEVS